MTETEEDGPMMGAPSTRIITDGAYLTVRFRGVDLVKVNYLEMTLNSGGTKNHLEQTRFNQTSRQLRLGYYITTVGGLWSVITDLDTYDFQDGMILYRSPGLNQEHVRYPPGGSS